MASHCSPLFPRVLWPVFGGAAYPQAERLRQRSHATAVPEVTKVTASEIYSADGAQAMQVEVYCNHHGLMDHLCAKAQVTKAKDDGIGSTMCVSVSLSEQPCPLRAASPPPAPLTQTGSRPTRCSRFVLPRSLPTPVPSVAYP